MKIWVKLVILVTLLFGVVSTEAAALERYAGIEITTLESAVGCETVKVWERATSIFPSGSKFITDVPFLERISRFSTEGSIFRNKLSSNWEEALDDILKNSTDLKCSTCGNQGRIGRSQIDQYLDDIEHFIGNYDVSPNGKGEVFFNWMRGTTNPTSGQVDELHQTLRDLAKRGIKESDVIGLGKQFPIGSKRYDLRRIGDKYIEYKNKDFVNTPLTAASDDVDQMINGYLKNINSFDNMEWKVGLDKLLHYGWTETNALSNMKAQWKKVFESRADDAFNSIWNNESLRGNFFGALSVSQTSSRTFFNTLVSNTDDRLFKFISVE